METRLAPVSPAQVTDLATLPAVARSGEAFFEGLSAYVAHHILPAERPQAFRRMRLWRERLDAFLGLVRDALLKEVAASGEPKPGAPNTRTLLVDGYAVEVTMTRRPLTLEQVSAGLRAKGIDPMAVVRMEPTLDTVALDILVATGKVTQAEVDSWRAPPTPTLRV